MCESRLSLKSKVCGSSGIEYTYTYIVKEG